MPWVNLDAEIAAEFEAAANTLEDRDPELLLEQHLRRARARDRKRERERRRVRDIELRLRRRRPPPIVPHGETRHPDDCRWCHAPRYVRKGCKRSYHQCGMVGFRGEIRRVG